MAKILATDLDGTLFYPKDNIGMISKPNLFFIQSFIDNGGKVVLISGRSHSYIKKVINRIWRPCAGISDNGGCVYDGEKLVRSKAIPNDEANEIIEEIKNTYKIPGIFLMTENGLSIYLRYKSKFIRWLYKLYYKTTGIYAENLLSNEEDYYKELKEGKIFKIMIYFGLGKRKQNRAKQINTILRNVYDNVECNRSKNVIEITAKDCSKASSLLDLLSSMNASKDDVYVVGDSGNDISMFKVFQKNSFCMGHAPNAVKKYARYTIEKFEDLSRYISEK